MVTVTCLPLSQGTVTFRYLSSSPGCRLNHSSRSFELAFAAAIAPMLPVCCLAQPAAPAAAPPEFGMVLAVPPVVNRLLALCRRQHFPHNRQTSSTGIHTGSLDRRGSTGGRARSPPAPSCPSPRGGATVPQRHS